ncbi:MAG: biotin transporter BioY [Oscillospiraceae bacterium]|nr:biotin transporter BioY [Oscillospiraceae bacterium]
MKLKTKDLALCALFAALIAVCAWISIPATVPFTLQTFAVFAALGLLGGKRGTVAVAVYLLLGAVGLPVFAGFQGGIGALLGTTGGYLLGFLLTALIVWGFEARFGSKTAVFILAAVLGMLVCYAFGTAWYLVVYARTKGAISLTTALGWCVVPFLFPDAVKLALAVLLRGRLKRHVPA